MKWLLSLLPCLLAFQCLAQSQTASVTATCRSLSLYSATAFSGAAPLLFTTTDGSTGLPQYVPGNPPVFSGELQPHSGQSSSYDTDYAVLSGNNLSQYGAFTLTLPTADTNHDGIPELLDLAQPMYSTALGTGHNSWPSTNASTLDLRFNRPAGSPTGAFSGIWTYSGSSFIVNGAFSLMLLQGNLTYTRGATNQLQLVLTRVMLNGTTNTLTGTVNYTATANQISLPRFTLASSFPGTSSSTVTLTNVVTTTNIVTVSDTETVTNIVSTTNLVTTNIVVNTSIPGPTYTALHTVLTRHGQRYTGNLSFVDGAPETPWPDYLNWVVSLTDTNDADGNGIPDLSDPSAVQLPSALLTITTNGAGAVSPALDGQNLVLGRTYHLTATPAAGYLFTGWTGWSGDLVSTARTLTFTMSTNLNLQANFVPNPFYPVRGTYYGLIEDTNNFANQTLGSFTATATAGGTYSAKIQLGGKSFSVSGALDATGSNAVVVAPPGRRPLSLQLQLDLTHNTGLSGTIGDGTWSATIVANQSPFNAALNRCPFAGKYTFALPPSGTDGAPPLGSSYGTVSVDTAGHVRCSGWLADGTRLSQSTGLSGTGDWPLYASLYKHQGCLAGWLTLTNLEAVPSAGLPVWVKPAATTKLAAAGFTNQVTWLCSPYTAPLVGQPPVDWTNGLIDFSGAEVVEPFSLDLNLGTHYKLASTSTNQLSLRLLGNGLFQGRVLPPGARRPVSFQGALLQSLSAGLGYLPGTNASDAVGFGALPPP